MRTPLFEHPAEGLPSGILMLTRFRERQLLPWDVITAMPVQVVRSVGLESVGLETLEYPIKKKKGLGLGLGLDQI